MSTDRLLLDTMLGKLTTYLRMCGHDAAYALDRGIESDEDVLALARSEGRRLITRDVPMAARAEDAILLTAKDITEQLREVGDAGIDLSLDEPTRCGRCNGRLVAVEAGTAVPAQVPDPAAQSVWRCLDCGQCFWRGSHWDDVVARLADL